MPVYLITYTILFWLPVAVFCFLFFKLLSGHRKKSFWITTGLMAIVSVVMEYFYLKYDTWSFSEAIDPLLGIWFGKAPIEEFVYWFGATPFCLSIYLVYSRFMGENNNA